MSNMDSQTMIKYAAASIGAIALAGLAYYLSKEETLDYKVYTADKLKAVMAELQLELTCIYSRNYNLMLRLKENGDWKEDALPQLRNLVNREIEDKTQQVVEEYDVSCHPLPRRKDASGEKQSISMHQFELWVEQFEDEPFIVRDRDAMIKLDADLFERQKIDELTFDDYPEELTAEKYLTMFKKVFAVLRHDLYKDVEAKKKELRTETLGE